MTPEDDTASVDDAQSLADFAGGFDGKTADKIAAKEKPAPATEAARAEAEPKPEYVQITAKDWDEIKAAAARTASYEKQFSSFNGKLGNIYTTLNSLKEATPRDLEVKLPDQAFTKMAKDYPELAELSREEFQAALAGLKGAKPDGEAIKKIQMELEQEDLDDAIPDWRTIVGAVQTDKEQPDQNNAFRKWLATKPDEYQARINGTIRAPVIQRAIRLFQNETKAPAKPAPAVTPRDTARAERIRDAVQPKGDGAVASSGNSEADAFAAGFNSR